MSARKTLLGLCVVSLSAMLSVGCDPAAGSFGEGEVALGETVQALSSNGQAALTFAEGWISDVNGHPEKLAENVYTASAPSLLRADGAMKATNRSVCGTFITQLVQKSTSLTSNDFYKSFNKAMDGTCEVGTIATVQKGTSSPDAAQYRYKISTCAATGPVKFTARTTLSAIEAGDVLAVTYPERTDISGHVMLVRSAPVVDSTLPAGPADTTAYAVSIIDSTSTPHGTSTTYPDWRGGNTGEGLGTGTFVLYANASGAIVASRWSPTDSTLYTTTEHPLAVGGLQ